MQRSSLRIETTVANRAPRPVDIDVDIVDRRLTDSAAERRALVAGLLETPASIAPKYFYDATGCRLFCKICNLPEYYPTRTEARIFDRWKDEIVAAIGSGKQLVDLGAADCAKGAAWLPWLQPTRYVAVDIADDALEPALSKLALAYPQIDVRGVLTDFTRGLDLTLDIAEGPTTYFYPGSSIGNFAPAEALQFLQRIRRHCGTDAESGLLIGVDTKKDPARLQAAYDDAAGVTAAFNRNVLTHVNRVLGTHFRPDGFRHVALYNEAASRIEMHLEAIDAQTVTIDGITRIFRVSERIHTESSYKYAPAEFVAMLQRAGFSSVRVWQDEGGDFAVYHASTSGAP
jgi:dimethylhistidine N-methyltransferase